MRSGSVQAPTATSLAAAAAVLAGLLLLVACGAPEGVQDVSQTLNQPGVDGMNKGGSTFVGVIVLLLAPILMWVWISNSLVSKEESTFAAWAQVESNYQRRNDLIPRLVESVSRYLKHESETLTRVVQERNADKAALEQAEARLAVGVKQVMALVEAYPELRSADQFLQLQAQLEGTENRINVARTEFNDVVSAYNASIRKIPGSLVASTRGLQRKGYFQADDSARESKPLGLD